MESKKVRGLDAGRRVQGSLDTQAAVIGTTVPASLRAKLDTAVTQLVQFGQEQDSSAAGAAGETTTQIGLRSDLFQNLVGPISQAARMALREAPDFAALVIVSDAQRSADFLTKVNSQIEAAAKYQPTFVDHGLPTDFVAQVRTAQSAITASEDNRARLLSRRSAATLGIKTADTKLRQTITNYSSRPSVSG